MIRPAHPGHPPVRRAGTGGRGPTEGAPPVSEAPTDEQATAADEVMSNLSFPALKEASR